MSYSLLHLSHLKNDFPPPEAAPECFSKSLPILCILKFKESTMPVKSMNLEGSNQSCAAIMDNSSSGGGGGGGSVGGGGGGGGRCVKEEVGVGRKVRTAKRPRQTNHYCVFRL